MVFPVRCYLRDSFNAASRVLFLPVFAALFQKSAKEKRFKNDLARITIFNTNLFKKVTNEKLAPASLFPYPILMLEVLHIIISIFLALTILLQSRASGLSATFGGSGASLAVQRRGAEKLIYKASIWLAVAFFALSILRWYV